MRQPLFEHRLTLAGVETRALELLGDGPPVLLLPGLGAVRPDGLPSCARHVVAAVPGLEYVLRPLPAARAARERFAKLLEAFLAELAGARARAD